MKKKYRILVADDDFDNRAIASLVLVNAGYEVIEAVNGVEAVDKTLAQRPDLLLLDLSMPRMNGLEAAQKLRETLPQGTFPIVAFTAHALMGDDLKAKAAGCDDYLAKPCLPEDILRKIRKWLPEDAVNP